MDQNVTLYKTLSDFRIRPKWLKRSNSILLPLRFGYLSYKKSCRQFSNQYPKIVPTNLQHFKCVTRFDSSLALSTTSKQLGKLRGNNDHLQKLWTDDKKGTNVNRM